MPIRPQCSRIAMTYNKESAYGTAVSDNNMTKLFEPNEPAIMDFSQTRIDDADLIKGHEFPQTTALDIVIAQDISIPFNFPASLQLVGLLYSLALGGKTTTGAGDPYSHVLKMLDACVTDNLPSTSWLVGLLGDTASKLLLKGVVIEELKLVLDKVGRLNITGSAKCDGTLTAKPAVNFPTVVAGQDWLFSTQCDFKINTVSYKTGNNKIRSFDFGINNNLDLADGRSNPITSGKFLSDLRFGKRAVNLTAKFDGHQGDTLWNFMINETSLAIEIPIAVEAIITDGGVKIEFPVCKIANIKPGFDGIRDVLDVTFKVFFDTSTSSPVTVTVYNDVATYLT